MTVVFVTDRKCNETGECSSRIVILISLHDIKTMNIDHIVYSVVVVVVLADVGEMPQ